MDDILGSGDENGVVPGQSGSGAFVAWVAFDDDGATHGRIMLRLTAPDMAERAADAPISAFFPANDNEVWVGDEFGSGAGGAIGRDPTVLGLDTGDTLIAWIGADNEVHAKVYPPVSTAAEGEAYAPVDLAAYEELNDAISAMSDQDKGDDDRNGGAAKQRVQMVDLGLGQFAILWAAVGASGLIQLAGTVVTHASAGSDGADGGTGWVQSALDPVDLPAGAGGDVEIVGGALADGILQLSVSTGDAEGVSITLAMAQSAPQHVDASAAAAQSQPSGADVAAGEMALASIDVANGQDADGIEAVEAPYESVAVSIADAVDETGAEITERRPVVATSASGEIIIGHLADGDDGHAAFVVNRLASDGSRAGSAGGGVTVSTNAVGDGPAVVSSVDDSALAVWLEDTGSGYELRSQLIERDGGMSDAPVVIATASAPSAISSVSVSQSYTSHSEYAWQYFVSWIEDLDGDGYGSLHMQRYGLNWGENGVVQTLFADDDEEGDDVAADAPETDAVEAEVPAPISDDTGSSDVEARGTTSTGLDDGDFAVAWVERSTVEIDGVETVVETISGRVLEAMGGDEVFRIDIDDLAGFDSVNKDYSPEMMATDRGDIVIGWVGNKHGDYVVQVAVYSALGDDRWNIPDQVIDLKNFGEDAPRRFDISVVGEDTPEIVLTWRDSGRIYAQTFGLDGEALGNPFVVSYSNSGSSNNADDMDAVGMPDGTFVVVYSEADEDGDDVDIEARIFDMKGEDAPDASADATAAPSDSTDMSAALFGANTDNLIFAISADGDGSNSGPGGGFDGGEIDMAVLEGLEGADTFHFRAEIGEITVTDFNSMEDVLEFSSDLVDNYDDLWAAIESLADGAHFDFGDGNVVFLSGVDAAGLNASNVRIVDPDQL